MKYLVAIALVAGTNCVMANMVDTQMSILIEKSELCLRSKDFNSEHCKDFMVYNRHVFKGNAPVYIEYHMDNGNINNKNGEYVLSALRISNRTYRMIIEQARKANAKNGVKENI